MQVAWLVRTESIVIAVAVDFAVSATVVDLVVDSSKISWRCLSAQVGRLLI